MSTSETITKTDLKNILEAAGNIGQVDSTPTPTASKVSEFDAAAQMNSTDMTSQEVTSFVEDLNIEGGGSGTSIPTANTTAKFDANAHMNSTDMTNAELASILSELGYETPETFESYVESLVASFVNAKGRAFREYTSSATVVSGGSFSFSVDIVTHGGPVLVIGSCTWNGDAAGYWGSIYVSRGGTVLKQATMVSSSGSYNVPGTVVYIDYVNAGTYTYTCTCCSGSGAGTFAENNSGRSETPILCAIEL